ncbi:hypothetical protein E2C01_075862 [Portunus trituberculatus]|uniref:Uncharacterized protein n=1 Tax=Portunus trituberculatus TaxID=210409 RepID=A0A5B7IG58_PORTR|nr:hypothetical protein [Portunus trituberculatus]
MEIQRFTHKQSLIGVMLIPLVPVHATMSPRECPRLLLILTASRKMSQ